jgi:uncharacterized protein (DUF488 family)
MANPFYTIGQATRTLDEFFALLKDARIATLVDVRRIPRSATNPQFNGDTLPDALAPSIGYRHMGDWCIPRSDGGERRMPAPSRPTMLTPGEAAFASAAQL